MLEIRREFRKGRKKGGARAMVSASLPASYTDNLEEVKTRLETGLGYGISSATVLRFAITRMLLDVQAMSQEELIGEYRTLVSKAQDQVANGGEGSTEENTGAEHHTAHGGATTD